MRREKKSSEEEAPKGRFHSELFDWGEALILSLTIVIMVPTLQNGNQLLVSNLFYTPEKGDIVILTKDSFMTSPIVKRVIATEGDTVDIDFETGEVSVNGEVLDETYIAEKTQTHFDMDFPQTVPEGCIFVMGDNRNHSTDSRCEALGMVDTRYVIGKVLMRIYPLNEVGTVS